MSSVQQGLYHIQSLSLTLEEQEVLLSCLKQAIFTNTGWNNLTLEDTIINFLKQQLENQQSESEQVSVINQDLDSKLQNNITAFNEKIMEQPKTLIKKLNNQEELKQLIGDFNQQKQKELISLCSNLITQKRQELIQQLKNKTKLYQKNNNLFNNLKLRISIFLKKQEIISDFQTLINKKKEESDQLIDHLVKQIQQKKKKVELWQCINNLSDDEQKKLIMAFSKLITKKREKLIQQLEKQEEFSRKGIHYEDELIAKRLTWMTTVQGFMFSALGFSFGKYLTLSFYFIIGFTGIAISVSTWLVLDRAIRSQENYVRMWQELQMKIFDKEYKIIFEKIKAEFKDKNKLKQISANEFNPTGNVVGHAEGYFRFSFLTLGLKLGERINNELNLIDYINQTSFEIPSNLVCKNRRLPSRFRSSFFNWLSPPRFLPFIFGIAWISIIWTACSNNLDKTVNQEAQPTKTIIVNTDSKDKSKTVPIPLDVTVKNNSIPIDIKTTNNQSIPIEVKIKK
ncbi:MAG: hypothetical protein VKJ02_01395 [Snowella sp.]|nr:hypothetical protein [Snowella sp.]